MPRSKVASSHLRRLDRVYLDTAIYFMTTCTSKRQRVLANDQAAQILRDQFAQAPRRYGWRIGRYVIMPDHIHLFCASGGERETTTLSIFVAASKCGPPDPFSRP